MKLFLNSYHNNNEFHSPFCCVFSWAKPCAYIGKGGKLPDWRFLFLHSRACGKYTRVVYIGYSPVWMILPQLIWDVRLGTNSTQYEITYFIINISFHNKNYSCNCRKECTVPVFTICTSGPSILMYHIFLRDRNTA